MSEENKNIEEGLRDEGEGYKEDNTPIPETSPEPKPSTLNPQPSDMEVHHHGHVHEKKKWKEYVFQFLMLFLAVFCGFLAEYQLEHTIEHQRAQVYAANLSEELKKDTASLNELIDETEIVIGKLDTFCLYSTEKTKRNVSNGMLYYYSSYTTFIEFFSSNNTTIEQMKGSGNLRIMGNAISQKISGYSKKLSQLDNEYQLTKSEFSKIEELYFKIFDGYITDYLSFSTEFDRSSFHINRDSVFELALPLISDDPKLMREFTGWLKFETSIYKMQNRDHLRPLKQFAIELLALLKKEYQLK